MLYRWNYFMNKKHLPIIVILLVLLLIGLFIVGDYGESWDEKFGILYGETTFQNYKNIFSTEGDFEYGPNLKRFYGPLFDLITHIGNQIASLIMPGISIITTRHFLYFASFLAAAGSIYGISIQLFKIPTSILVTILFVTQPVLWGHAFINPKDIPFMSAFSLAMFIGVYAIKKISPRVSKFEFNIDNKKLENIKDEWNNFENKRMIINWGSIFLISILLIWLARNATFTLIERLVGDFYSNEGTIWNTIFNQFAINKGEVFLSSYIAKSIIISKRIFTYYIFLGSLFFIIIPFRVLKTPLIFIRQLSATSFIKDLGSALKHPWIILAGICIGAATAIRILGPFAGILLSFYILLIYKRNSLQLIIVLGVISILSAILFWPYLWASPIAHLFESIIVMTKFPWSGNVLFNGNFIKPINLPGSYLPVLFTTQFTESTIILFIFGGILGLKQIIQKKKNWQLILLIYCWFFVPFIFFILNPSSLYDNFRQLLFFVPPIFIIGGLLIEFLVEKIKSVKIQWVFAVLILIPGIFGIIKLHPYQYTYYNSFVGGTGGVFRRFETDYWVTSFGEAIEFLNESAGESSRILVWSSYQSVKRIARPDLIVEGLRNNNYDLETGYDFAIQSTRWDQDLNNFPSAPIIFTVERDGAVFAVVKQLRCTEINPCP